jgi:ubiquinone/menaquinone biosynthesis C-methylase UbiE
MKTESIDGLNKVIDSYLISRNLNPKDRDYKNEFNHHFATIERAKIILDKIKIFYNIDFKDKYVLDAGCGSGGISILLSNEDCKSFAVDLDSKKIMIGVELQKLENKYVNFLVADLNTKIFNENSFDNIFSIDLLEHVENPDKILENLIRYLKPDGFLIFKVGNKYFPYEPHIRNFCIHFLPNRIINLYLKYFYNSFFNFYSDYNDIKLFSYNQLVCLLNTFNNIDYQIVPIFYPYIPIISSYKPINTIQSFLLSCEFTQIVAQSWIVFCKKRV